MTGPPRPEGPAGRPAAGGRPELRGTDGVLALGALLLAMSVVVGSGAMWPAALGGEILRVGRLVDGVPYASAPTTGWPNPLVLTELLLHGLDVMAPAAMAIAQLALVIGVWWVLASRLHHGEGTRWRAPLALAAVILGAADAWAVARAASLSLVGFLVVLLLLQRDSRSPSRRVWLVIPVVALWANLHGGVVIGVATIAAYALSEKVRTHRGAAIGLLAGAILAPLATPAGPRTWAWIVGVLGGEAPRTGAGLWGGLAPWTILGALTTLAVLVLLVVLPWRRLRVWEWVLVLGLLAGAVVAVRLAPQLLLALALVGRAPGRTPETPTGPRKVSGVRWGKAAEGGKLRWGLGVVVVVLVVVVLAGRGSGLVAPGAAQASEVVRLAAGRIVFAPEPFAETLAARGARLWAANPLDAFTPDVQAAYLAFVADPASGADTPAQVIVVDRASSAFRGRAGWVPLGEVGPYAVYARSP